jgi:internalin A
MEFIWPWLSGQFNASIFAFYDFMFEVMGVKIKPELLQKYQIWKRTAEYGPIWPLEKLCIVCRRPQAIHKKGEQLHRETGPAVQYPRYGVYALNGVRVPEWLVMTKESEITGDTILKEDNAEIRREIIRKIGVERVVRDLGAECIDKEGEYELLLLDLQDGRKRPYLKMQNPSIDAVHIEGVHPDCRTVQAALRWRNGVDEKPLVLT